MQHYDKKNYQLDTSFNKVSFLIIIIGIVGVLISKNNCIYINNFVQTILISYLIIGGLSDLLVNFVIGCIWGHKSLSDKDVGAVNKKVLIYLRKVNWLPRIVGIIERIIFTTSFIIGKYQLITIWLVLKVVGDWKKVSFQDEKKRKNSVEPWRVKENIFLIGTALSLILSYIAAEVFLKIK